MTKDISLDNDSPSVSEESTSSSVPPKKSIIEPLETVTKGESGSYRNYFDREGGAFPDLFSRDVASRNDCASLTKYVATSRAPAMYSDLLTAYISSKVKAREAEKKRAGLDTEMESKEAKLQFVTQLLKGFIPSGSSLSGSIESDLSEDGEPKKEKQK